MRSMLEPQPTAGHPYENRAVTLVIPNSYILFLS